MNQTYTWATIQHHTNKYITFKQNNFHINRTFGKTTGKYVTPRKQIANLALHVIIIWQRVWYHCPRYLKVLTYCNDLPLRVNWGKLTFIILDLSLGSNIMQTDFLALGLQTMSIESMWWSRIANYSCCRALHKPIRLHINHQYYSQHENQQRSITDHEYID